MKAITTRRNEILDEMSEIKRMRRGVLNVQYKNVSHKNGDIAVKGPYYVLTKKGPNGKTISQAISAKDAEFVQVEVDNYRRFRQLTDEYVDVCENLTLLKKNETDECKKN